MDSTNNRPEDVPVPEEKRPEAETKGAAGAENAQPKPRPALSRRPRRARTAAKVRGAARKGQKAEKAAKKAEKKAGAKAEGRLRREASRRSTTAISGWAAEYDNYRKRSARERESFYADVRADTVIKFLPCTTTSSARWSSPPPTRPTARAWR